MDPNAANLDPKLKEMYNRVMNTSVPPPPTGGTPPSAPDPIQSPTTPPTSPNPTDPTNGQQIPTPPQMPVPPEPVAPLPQEPQAPTPSTSIPEAPATPIQSGQTTQMHAAVPMSVGSKPVSAAIVGGSAKKKGGSIFPILLALGGIIFLAVYSVFWIKFFNLRVPFLPF